MFKPWSVRRWFIGSLSAPKSSKAVSSSGLGYSIKGLQALIGLDGQYSAWVLPKSIAAKVWWLAKRNMRVLTTIVLLYCPIFEGRAEGRWSSNVGQSKTIFRDHGRPMISKCWTVRRLVVSSYSDCNDQTFSAIGFGSSQAECCPSNPVRACAPLMTKHCCWQPLMTLERNRSLRTNFAPSKVSPSVLQCK